MKHYSYSVKEELGKYFGADTLNKMRIYDSAYVHKTAEEQKHMIPLLWYHADKHAMGMFLSKYFLLETVLCDDYIAYIVQVDKEKAVFLSFLYTDKEAPFALDPEYAYALTQEWSAKGYRAYILRVCVMVSPYGEGFRVWFEGGALYDMALLEAKKIGDRCLLVHHIEMVWDILFTKVLNAITQDSDIEFERLFSREVRIIGHQEEVLGKGIDDAKRLLRSLKNIRVAYTRINDSVFTTACVYDDGSIRVSVDRQNRIVKISITKEQYHEFIDVSITPDMGMYSSVPELCCVTALEPKEMHALAVRLYFSDGSKRNYYLATFKERDIPDKIEVEGACFEVDTIRSVKLIVKGNEQGIVFANGLFISERILFRDSYRCVDVEKLDGIIYKDDDLSIHKRYRVPLNQGWRFGNWYYGNVDECFGPARSLLDKQGNVISNILVTKEDRYCGGRFVKVLPDGLYGYIKEDGTWLFPSIYSKASDFGHYDNTVAWRDVDGCLRQFLITAEGKETRFDYCLEREDLYDGVFPFMDRSPYDDVEEASRTELWGLANDEGEVILPPTYDSMEMVFVNKDYKYVIAAKKVGDISYYGLIDLEGNERIPCIYSYIAERGLGVLVISKHGSELEGLIDLQGNIILEPAFKEICDFDEKHMLVAAGDDEDAQGVYSIERGEFILPPTNVYIMFEEKLISCETVENGFGVSKWYDYEGNVVFNSELTSRYGYDEVTPCVNRLRVRENDKYGYIDHYGNVIVPPILREDEQILDKDKGLIKTTVKKRYGVRTVTDEEVLPPIYNAISYHEGLIVASMKTDGNWSINDTLFTADGRLIMQGPYRNLDMKDGYISVETPLGEEVYELRKRVKI